MRFSTMLHFVRLLHYLRPLHYLRLLRYLRLLHYLWLLHYLQLLHSLRLLLFCGCYIIRRMLTWNLSEQPQIFFCTIAVLYINNWYNVSCTDAQSHAQVNLKQTMIVQWTSMKRWLICYFSKYKCPRKAQMAALGRLFSLKGTFQRTNNLSEFRSWTTASFIHWNIFSWTAPLLYIRTSSPGQIPSYSLEQLHMDGFVTTY